MAGADGTRHKAPVHPDRLTVAALANRGEELAQLPLEAAEQEQVRLDGSAVSAVIH